MLTIADIYKNYPGKQALAGISFEVQAGETVAVLGPSGCGKSTLLSIIAGLDQADQGEIYWAGESLAGVPPYRRNFGLMFQDFALFPHMNVFANVAFGLQMENMPIDQVRHRVGETLELVGLPGYEQRDVNTLSGGEQQRVALARALAPSPRLLMLDEPLGSLDRTLRERLVIELREILKKSRQTAIYVTHDQEEAFTLADRLVVMNAGKIEQVGKPQEIYCSPATIFVAQFLGLTNLIPARLREDGTGHSLLDTPLGLLPLPENWKKANTNDPLTLLLRPDKVQVREDGPCVMQGILLETIFQGSLTRATILINDFKLVFDFSTEITLPAPGGVVHLCFDPHQALQILSN